MGKGTRETQITERLVNILPREVDVVVKQLLPERFDKGGKSLLLLKAFIRDPASIGAISPSSQSLAKAMTCDLTVRPGEVIVELGPGTGALTAQIRKIIPESSNYLGVEREPIFVQMLRERFPELRIVNGLAESAGEMYKENGLKRPKAIISGVPSSTQSRKTLDSIIRVLDQIMVTGSVFRTFQYVHAFPLPSARHFRQKMDSVFGPHRRGRVVIKNLPPAIVLTWQKSECEGVVRWQRGTTSGTGPSSQT